MGAAQSVASVVLVGVGIAIKAALSILTGTPRSQNETHDAIWQREQWENQQREERERIERENEAKEKKLRQEMEKRAEAERKRVERELREEKERHEKELEKMRKEEEQRVERARQLREEEMKRQKEEMERLRKREETERKRVAEEQEKLRKEMERREAAARAQLEELARKAAQQAELERKRHEEERQRLEEASKAKLALERVEAERILQEQRETARREREELEREQARLEVMLTAGIQPEVWPTAEEREKAEKQLIQPRGQYFHCAIAGLAGSGKSSLINAFRGLRNNSKSPAVAPTGVTETTMTITAYPDPATEPPRNRFVWYDVPGAGTLKIKGWQYFNSQGLFVFDFIIVVVDNRFSEQDLIILQHCERYKIPSFIVRSKANQHIDNTMKQEEDWDGESDDELERSFDEVYTIAREKVISKTRASIRENLREGGLNPSKRVYIVSCDALAAVVQGNEKRLRKQNQLIDEQELILGCLETVRRRRF